MTQEQIFKELIATMAKDGEISSSEYAILLSKGKDLGLTKETVDMLIKLELADSADEEYEPSEDYEEDTDEVEEDYHHHERRNPASHFSSGTPRPRTYPTVTIKSAITRGGGILTPDVITIDNDSVSLKKRNKYLINCDTVSLPLSTIASVVVDTSIWGTDIIITSFGGGTIHGHKFTKSDAKRIKQIIQERQNGR